MLLKTTIILMHLDYLNYCTFTDDTRLLKKYFILIQIPEYHYLPYLLLRSSSKALIFTFISKLGYYFTKYCFM